MTITGKGSVTWIDSQLFLLVVHACQEELEECLGSNNTGDLKGIWSIPQRFHPVSQEEMSNGHVWGQGMEGQLVKLILVLHRRLSLNLKYVYPVLCFSLDLLLSKDFLLQDGSLNSMEISESPSF